MTTAQTEARAIDALAVSAIANTIGYHLASIVSGNNMPDMSGDPRRRIPEHKRRHFDDACLSASEAILSTLTQENAELRSEVERLRACQQSGDQGLNVALIRTALEHASFALNGIVALDPEDECADGASSTCQHAKRTVDRALRSLLKSTGAGR